MLEQLGSLSEAISQPYDIALRSQIGCLWLMSLEISRLAALEWSSANENPRAGVLACPRGAGDGFRYNDGIDERLIGSWS
jgi:hypothetical protein